MINEKELKDRMAGALELIKTQIPEFCEENGASKKDFTVATVSAFKTIEGIVDKLAAKGCWIPCSERLPEEPKENPLFEGAKVELYLVSCGEEFYPFRAFWNGKNFTDGLCKVDVEAWMPLPEPYKEREEE